MPTPELLEQMGAFNQQLKDAGIFVDADGLRPSAKGARVAFSGQDRSVTKGPFPNVHDLVAGYWIWNVHDLDEAIDWVKRCPNPMPGPRSSKSARIMKWKTSTNPSRGESPRRGRL